MCFSWLAQTKRIQRDHLVRGKTIVQFANPHLPRLHPRLLHRNARRVLRHAEAHEIYGRAVEERRAVGGETHACDLDSLGAEMRAGGEEGFGDDDGGGAAVGGGAALEFCEGGVDFLGGEDVGKGVGFTDLGVGVLCGMEVVDAGDFGEVGGCGAVSDGEWIVSCLAIMLLEGGKVKEDALLHILPPRIPKHLRSTRRIGPPPRNLHHLPRRPHRIGPILVETLKRARKHLFKANDHDTIRHTMAYHIPSHV